jgi:two-component system NarL family response regulator
MSDLGGPRGDPSATRPPGDPEPDTIRVLVVDDHALFRRGICQVLLGEEGIDVVGEAEDGAEAHVMAVRLRPDVVLMDVNMPGTGGIEATGRITVDVPDVRILMLTVSDDEEDLFRAITAGAVGYLLKEISSDEVAEAVRAVVRGQTLLSPAMASKLIGEYATLARRVAASSERVAVPRLTPREREVLALVAHGCTNRDIGRQLFISGNTVKNHVRNILEKLQIHTRAEAVVFAVRENLLEPEDEEVAERRPA